MNTQSIKKYLSVIRRACDLIEQQLEEDVSQAFDEVVNGLSMTNRQAQPSVNSVPTTSAMVTPVAVVEPQQFAGFTEEEMKRQTAARLKHIDDLMGIECWPPAISQFQADAKPTEADMINRANAVIDMTLGSSIEGAHFLDYGCGDGYIASQIALRGAASITGYDITPSDHWQKLGTDKVNFTSDTGSLQGKGYNQIFLYDVLDHAVDPEGVMSHIKYLAAPGAIIYVRCHPWTSKHASHLPKVGLNKSYIHLFLTFEELVNKGFKPLFTRAEKNPIEAYRWWFRDFKIIKEKPTYDDVSEFFHVPSFKELLASEQQLKPEDVDGFLDRMRLQYVDYVLENP